MDARMMIQSPTPFMSDAPGLDPRHDTRQVPRHDIRHDTRRAAILRAATLPDAPLTMPQQVIEMPLSRVGASVGETGVKGLSRFLALLATGFGRTAGGR